jgi:DNA-binding transcriptional LysR family regulator
VVIRIGALGDSSLVSRPLGRYRRVAVCAPSYLRGREAPEVPADLARHNCLRYRRSGERVAWHFARPDSGETIEHLPQGDFFANDVEVLLGAAESGLGVALLPYWLVREHLDTGALVQLLRDFPLTSTMQATGIHFVYLLNRRQSRKVHAFMDHVSGRVGHLLT